MSNINFYEIDSTTIIPEEIETNVIYIPGYATYGPVNTPTLCRSLKEFQSIFGDIPYSFEQDQPFTHTTNQNGNNVTINDLGFTSTAMKDLTNFAQQGEYEKSFILAQELLNIGLPVLFERVMDTEKEETFTAKDIVKDNSDKDLITLQAKYPGLSGTLLSGTIIFYNDATHTFEITIDKIENSNFFEDIPTSQKFTVDYDRNIVSYLDIDNTDMGKYITFDTSTGINIDNIIHINFTRIEDGQQVTDTKLEKTFELKIEEYSNNPRTEYEFEVKDIYNKLHEDTFFDKFEDSEDLQVKIVTTGAYPIFENTYTDTNSTTKYPLQNLITTLGKRGDAYCLVDVLYNPNRDITGSDSAYTILNSSDYDFLNNKVKEELGNKAEIVGKYGTMFLNWGVNKISTISGLTTLMLPPSFNYLYDLGISIQNGNMDSLAIAGVNRGRCDNYIRPSGTNRITHSISNLYQNESNRAINAILNENGYGYCIDGNRTLLKNTEGLIASSFLNVRAMVCDIKKRVRVALKRFLYENNSQVLWVNVKSAIEPILQEYIESGNITNYTINRLSTTKRATLEVLITLYLEYAIETFNVTINLKDEYSAQ